MEKHILRTLAFFYIAITASQATFLPLMIGGVVAGRVMLITAGAGAGIAAIARIHGAIHNQLHAYWKQHLGPQTQMPKTIKDSVNGNRSQEGGGADLESMVRFQSYLQAKTNININLNINQTINMVTGAQGGTPGAATPGAGPAQGQASGKMSSQWSGQASGQYSGQYSGQTSAQAHSIQQAAASVQNSIASLFFVEQDLSLGKKMNLHFTRTTNTAPFLPRDMVNQIPFSTAKFPELLNKLNLTTNSQEAIIMKETLMYCEDETKGDSCCTSLESMVDFVTSILGKSTKAISTNVDKNNEMEYQIQKIKKLPSGSGGVSCQKIPFPCAVFYCQKMENIHVMLATLMGSDKSIINAPVLCHEDTSSWDHSNWVFQKLNIQPGSSPICHFLLEDDVLWIAK